MLLSLWLSVCLSVHALAARTPSRVKRVASPFVTTSGSQFQLNGSPFTFVGTNAYWLPTLNTDEDINATFTSMKALGIKVVRTWGFNDVTTIPENGTWFQLISNGTTSVNTGSNGLQKLDTIIKLAEQQDIRLVLSLTNNWNPRPLLDNLTSAAVERRDVTPGNSLPRNFLSNDYGGMDTYVREFGAKNHDDFYTNPAILAAFLNYTTAVVSRYVQSTSVFGWELANDPRCSSSLPQSPSCNTLTITQWHSTVAQHIKSIDPNHLVSSGNQGFFCADCQKLFPTPSAPPPQTSPQAGRKRSAAAPVTKARLIRERIDAQKASRKLQKREPNPSSGVKIRGRWVATPTKRQSDTGIGSAFDGSEGVDSEDISNIPQIGFNTFQLFPDQNVYEPSNPNLPAFNNTVQEGIDWIRRQAAAGHVSGKPVFLAAFGLVTQDHAADFVPFNSTTAPFANQSTSLTRRQALPQQPFGVTNDQRDDAYNQWIIAGIQAGLQGIIQYQWAQSNLTTQPGTTISPTNPGTTESPSSDGTGESPDDGYSIQGVGQLGAEQIIGNAGQSIATVL